MSDTTSPSGEDEPIDSIDENRADEQSKSAPVDRETEGPLDEPLGGQPQHEDTGGAGIQVAVGALHGSGPVGWVAYQGIDAGVDREWHAGRIGGGPSGGDAGNRALEIAKGTGCRLQRVLDVEASGPASINRATLSRTPAASAE